jgi:hypothetical protein
MLAESLRILTDKIESLKKPIVEAKGHMDHPEDLVFLQGSAGVQRAIQALIDTVKNPNNITIKWDGYPALIFGYGPDGKFSIMDKHMFNKGTNNKARYIHSPEEFRQYDLDRGVDRSDLHRIIAEIWPELKRLTPKKPGYFWGDLLFSEPLRPQRDGLYHFQANPNGIQYTVDPKSEVGKKYFDGKKAGIVVHQSIPDNSETTDDSQLLNGSTGGLGQGKDVSVLPAKMPISIKLSMDKALLNNALKSERDYGNDLDEFFSSPPQAIDAFTNLFTSYINKKIVSRNLGNLVNDFYKYVESRPMTDSMRRKLLGYTDPNTNKHTPGYLDGNRDKIEKIFKIWIDIYNLKQNLVPQLDAAAENSPVQGYLKDGTRTQEGFVSQGLKLVNRMGFSAQNLAGRA